jgi:hypothetical protein
MLSRAGSAASRRGQQQLLAAAAAAAPRPCRRASWKLFDNLIPEDDAATKEAKEREARIIRAKMQRSKFAEASAASKEKLFVATADVAPPTADRLFPALAPCTPLADGVGGGPAALPAAFAQYPVTLVSIAFQGMGQAQLPAWHEAFVARYAPGVLAAGAAGAAGAGAPRVGLLNVIFLEGYVWRLLTGLIRGGLRRSVQPPEVAAHSVIAVETSEKAADGSCARACVGPSPPSSARCAHRRGPRPPARPPLASHTWGARAPPRLPTPLQHFCDALGIHNRAMGHLFLVDAAGHVRWRCVAWACVGERGAVAGAGRPRQVGAAAATVPRDAPHTRRATTATSLSPPSQPCARLVPAPDDVGCARLPAVRTRARGPRPSSRRCATPPTCC